MTRDRCAVARLLLAVLLVGAVDVGLRRQRRHRRQGLRRRQRHHHPARRRRAQEARRGVRRDPRRARSSRLTTTPARSSCSTSGGRGAPPCRKEARSLAAAAARARRRTTSRSSGVNTRDSSPDQGAGLRAPLRRALPLALRPGRPHAARLPRHPEPQRHPEHGGPRPAGPGGRQHPRRGAEPADAGRPGARRRRSDRPRDSPRPRRLVRHTGLDGSLLLGDPGGAGRRPGLVLLARAWCRCCRATSPTPPGCPAPTSPTRRRGRMLTGSLLFVLGFSFVFVSFGALIGAVGEWLFTYERQITDRARRPDDPARAGLPRRGAVAAARLAGPPGAGRRARRRAAARRAVRPGLGALHRPDPERRAVPVRSTRPAPGAGRCSAFVYCLGLGLPFIVAALAYRRMLGTVGWVRRHQQWVTAFGGADAGRRRAAAGHRLVGRDGRLDPRPGSSPASRRASEVAPRSRATGAAERHGRRRCARASSRAGRGASSPRCARR